MTDSNFNTHTIRYQERRIRIPKEYGRCCGALYNFGHLPCIPHIRYRDVVAFFFSNHSSPDETLSEECWFILAELFKCGHAQKELLCKQAKSLSLGSLEKLVYVYRVAFLVPELVQRNRNTEETKRIRRQETPHNELYNEFLKKRATLPQKQRKLLRKASFYDLEYHCGLLKTDQKVGLFVWNPCPTIQDWTLVILSIPRLRSKQWIQTFQKLLFSLPHHIYNGYSVTVQGEFDIQPQKKALVSFLENVAE